MHSFANCIRLGIGLVHTSLMWHFWESISILELWKKQTNKQKNTSNNCDLCFWFEVLAWDLDLGSWLGILTWDLDLGSLTGTPNASNLWCFPHTWTSHHGPIRSTVYSLNRFDWTSCSGKNPYPLPSSLFLWQKLQLRLSTIWHRSLWWYLYPNCCP